MDPTKKGQRELPCLRNNYPSYIPLILRLRPKSKPALPSTAKTTSCTGLKICMCIALTLRSDQRAFFDALPLA